MAEDIYMTHLSDLLSRKKLELDDAKAGILTSYRVTNRLLKKEGIHVFAENASDEVMDKSIEIIFRSFLEQLGTSLEDASIEELKKVVEKTDQELKYAQIENELIEEQEMMVEMLLDKVSG